MKFVATEDIAAPIDAVWSRVSDLDRFERRLSARVDGLARSPDGPAAPGTRWTGRAEVMGRTREIGVRLERMTVPTLLVAVAEGEGMTVSLTAGLEALAADRTRLTVTTEAQAQSLTARLMLQSVKLARQNIVRRYKARVADFAATIEAEARGAA